MIERKNRLIKCLRRDLQRSNRKIKEMQKKVEEIPKIDRKILKTIETLSSTEEHDVYSGIVMDQLRNFGKLKTARWNQNTIKHCIIMHAKSARYYKFLRRLKILHLPCPGTLSAYVGKSLEEVGFTTLVEKRIQEEVKKLEEIDKIGSIAIDEMTIKPMLKYKRNHGRFFGKVDMGNVARDESGRLANKVLAYVYTGLKKRINIPLAFFLVNKLKAEEQTKLTLYAVTKAESLGLRIERLSMDNLSTNVKMFSLLNSSKEHSTPVVPHPVDSVAASLQWPCIFRPLFLSFDPVHLLKNIRNQFIDREFLIKGRQVSFKTILNVYEKDKGKLTKFCRFLTQLHIAPNNLQRQKVKPALDVFRYEVSSAIKTHHESKEPGFENVDGILEFLEIMRTWYEAHDICNTQQAVMKRLETKQPFSNQEDEKFEFLENTFLNYLSDWNDAIDKEIDGIPMKKTKEGRAKVKNLKKKRFTKETYRALRFTTLSTVATVKHLLNEGFDYVLIRKFSSDSIEMFFGAMRQMMDGNFQGDAYSVITSFERIIKTGIAYCSLDGNTVLEREKPKEYNLLKEQRMNKKRSRLILDFLPSSYLLVLDELLVPASMLLLR